MDFPRLYEPTLPLHIHTLSQYSVGLLSNTTGAVASRSWPTANRALYIPFVLPWSYPVIRVFWMNGSAAGGKNDFGIYSIDGRRIYSTGETEQSGASAFQYVTPTAFELPAGSYYFGMAYSETTNKLSGTSSAEITNRLAGILQQASALPLPATATFAQNAAAVVPLCGITRTASGF